MSESNAKAFSRVHYIAYITRILAILRVSRETCFTILFANKRPKNKRKTQRKVADRWVDTVDILSAPRALNSVMKLDRDSDTHAQKFISQLKCGPLASYINQP